MCVCVRTCVYIYVRVHNLICITPEHVELWSLGPLLGFDPAHLDGVDQLHHLLVFPPGRDETALGLRGAGEGMDHLLVREEINVRLEGTIQGRKDL